MGITEIRQQRTLVLLFICFNYTATDVSTQRPIHSTSNMLRVVGVSLQEVCGGLSICKPHTQMKDKMKGEKKKRLSSQLSAHSATLQKRIFKDPRYELLAETRLHFKVPSENRVGTSARRKPFCILYNAIGKTKRDGS